MSGEAIFCSSKPPSNFFTSLISTQMRGDALNLKLEPQRMTPSSCFTCKGPPNNRRPYGATAVLSRTNGLVVLTISEYTNQLELKALHSKFTDDGWRKTVI